ncbi:homeobox protein H17 [Ctenocephalides felis]|uniref:homeobox protein H17 n=1 Tax=Ctenocephalides felis TaxID=7515 RepID=UPI000E6E127A|nr:homeobox protein H17 [Ctenocephalides felis]
MPVRRTPGRLPRIPFSPTQLRTLERAFAEAPYLSSHQAGALARTLQLTDTRVKIWFQNRRARARREPKNNTVSSTTSLAEHGSTSFNYPQASIINFPSGRSEKFKKTFHSDS